MKFLVPLSILFLFPFLLYAHDTLQYTSRQYTDENGLPQNSVKYMGFDRSGFLWLVTENGVVRFDGQNFRSFNKNQLPLESSRMAWLIPNRNTGGLIGITEKNQSVYMEDGQAGMHTGKSWLELSGNQQDPVTEVYKLYNALGLPDMYASLIQIERFKINITKDHYHILSKDSIIEWENGKIGSAIRYQTGDFYKYFLMGGRLYQLKGVNLTLIENGQVLPTGELQGDIRTQPGVLNGREQTKLYWSTSARQAFVVAGTCLYLLKPGGRNGLTTELLMHNFDYEANRILSILYDTRYKRIFMGSQTRGLFIFTRKPFYTLRSGQSDADEVYYAQAAINDNKILTPQGYLFELHKDNEVLQEFNKRMKEDRSSMVVDHRKNIWVKHRSNLYCFDPTGKKLLREFNMPRVLTVLYEDKDSNLVVGAKRAPSWRFSLNDPDAKPEIIYPSIKDLCFVQEEGKDKIWMGCGTGLYCIDKPTGKIDSIKELSGKYVRSLFVRQKGELWITTYEDGFYLYDGKKLTRMPADKGNFISTAHCILEDSAGFFWITTNKGLFQTSRQDLLDYAAGKGRNPFYLYYDKNAGFNTNEFNGGCQPCGTRLANGFFSFPSLNGLVLGNPSQLIPEIPSLNLFIDRIELDGKSIPLADTISLVKHFDFLRLFITMPYFGNPYNRQLDFSLVKDGTEGKWIPLDADGAIKLSSLASGSYEIRIRKVNGFGRNNYLVKSILLEVPLAFYETGWFRILLLVMLIGGFLLYTRIKLRYVQRKNAQLEEKIDERTQALQTTLTELQQSEESMRRQTRMQERLIAAITHDIKTPLKYLTSAALRLFGNTDVPVEKSSDENKRTAQMIYESGYRMYHLTDNLLQYIKLNSTQLNIVFDEICLYELVQAKLQIFNEIAAEQSTIIENKIPRGTYIRSNNHLLGIVIHNLIDNAVKATFNGTVSISTAEDENDIRISVKDSGFGMSRSTQEWCNNDQLNAGSDNGGAGKSGLGLIIVKDLVARMQGQIHVTDGKNGGTVVELIFRKK